MKKLAHTLIIFLLLTACSPKNEYTENNVSPIPQGVNVKDSHIKMNDNISRTDEERANYLAGLAAGIPNVHQVTAVVLGNFAIVGINVDKDLDRSKVGTIKYSVAESLKNDPQGAGAIVIADPDLYERLKEIRNDIANGKPVQGIMNEMADITGRLMPELPQQLDGVSPEIAPDKPMNEMNQQNDQELEKIQQEQSNNRKE